MGQKEEEGRRKFGEESLEILWVSVLYFLLSIRKYLPCKYTFVVVSYNIFTLRYNLCHGLIFLCLTKISGINLCVCLKFVSGSRDMSTPAFFCVYQYRICELKRLSFAKHREIFFKKVGIWYGKLNIVTGIKSEV